MHGPIRHPTTNILFSPLVVHVFYHYLLWIPHSFCIRCRKVSPQLDFQTGPGTVNDPVTHLSVSSITSKSRSNSQFQLLYHFSWFVLGCDLQVTCDQMGENLTTSNVGVAWGQGQKFGQPWDTEGEEGGPILLWLSSIITLYLSMSKTLKNSKPHIQLQGFLAIQWIVTHLGTRLLSKLFLHLKYIHYCPPWLKK